MPTCYSYIGLDTPPIDKVEDLFTLKAILPIQSLLMSLTTEKSLPEKLQKCTAIPAREYCTEYAKKVDNVLAECSEQLETVREQKGKYIPANENHNMACQIYQTGITGEDPKLSDDEKKIQKTCARYLNEHVLTCRDAAHGTKRVSPSWESVYSAKLSVYKKKIDKLINDKKT